MIPARDDEMNAGHGLVGWGEIREWGRCFGSVDTID
jgi:hypothetical protein